MNRELPESLRTLIAAEREAPVVGDTARASVRAKLGVTLGMATVASAGAAAATSSTATAATTTAATSVTATTTVAATTTAGAALKLGVAIKVLVVTVGLGAATTAGVATYKATSSRQSREIAAPTVEVASASRESEPTPTPMASRETAPVLAETPAVERAAPAEPPAQVQRPYRGSEGAKPVDTHVAVEPSPAPPSQAQLLADATRAFSKADHARALQLLDDDERLHAGGPLSEERDALRVSVLIASGRTGDARIRARELLARYPHTIHRAFVERVLDKEKDAP